MLVALRHGPLILDAVLDGRAADLGFSRFVPVEDVEEFFLVGFGFGFDFGLGAVGFPKVGVAAVGVEGLRWCERLLGGFSGGLLGWRWWRGGGGIVFYGGFFGEEISEGGIEVAERVGVGGFRGGGAP